MMRRANREKWNDQRAVAYSKATEIIQRKTAEAASDNAAVAQRIKAKLLKRLEKEIDALPELIGSETRQSVLENEYLTNEKGKPIGQKPSRAKEAVKAYNLRQLTQAYKDLTDDMNLTNNSDQVRIIIDV